MQVELSEFKRFFSLDSLCIQRMSLSLGGLSVLEECSISLLLTVYAMKHGRE